MDFTTIAGYIRPLSPLIGSVIGGPAVALAGAAIQAVADALGVPGEPDAIAGAIKENPKRAAEAISRLETERASEWISLAKAQTDLYAEITRSEVGKGAFWSAWRPAGMWAILGLWLWALVPAPLLGLSLDMGSLAAFTTLYLTLYMGGHTAKEWFSAHYAGKR